MDYTSSFKKDYLAQNSKKIRFYFEIDLWINNLFRFVLALSLSFGYLLAICLFLISTIDANS